MLWKFQLPPSFDGLGVKVFWRYFHKGWLTDLINEWISDRWVCRTAKATRGLSKNTLENPIGWAINFIIELQSLNWWLHCHCFWHFWHLWKCYQQFLYAFNSGTHTRAHFDFSCFTCFYNTSTHKKRSITSPNQILPYFPPVLSSISLWAKEFFLRACA